MRFACRNVVPGWQCRVVVEGQRLTVGRGPLTADCQPTTYDVRLAVAHPVHLSGTVYRRHCQIARFAHMLQATA